MRYNNNNIHTADHRRTYNIIYFIVYNDSDHRTLTKPTYYTTIRLCKAVWNALRWPEFSRAMRALSFPTYLIARSSQFAYRFAKMLNYFV